MITIGMVMLIVAASGAAAGARVVRASGDLIRYSDPYGTGVENPISTGASATVHATEGANGKTIVTLQVRGLPANREFGAHAHVLACNNNKAGGHYQNVPAAPSGNTSDFANPQNEIWLDFTTNSAGNGSAQTTVAWTFRTDGANAVIIHDHHTTDTDPGAGTAGSKLACLNVDF
jgi:Cu-Zn family superoxide dismutase